MDFSQNYENLLKQMKFKREEGKVTHNNFKISPLLPFRQDTLKELSLIMDLKAFLVNLLGLS